MHMKHIPTNPINIMPILNTGRSLLQQPYINHSKIQHGYILPPLIINVQILINHQMVSITSVLRQYYISSTSVLHQY